MTLDMNLLRQRRKKGHDIPDGLQITSVYNSRAGGGSNEQIPNKESPSLRASKSTVKRLWQTDNSSHKLDEDVIFVTGCINKSDCKLTAEFKRITTISLLSKFFSMVDAHSSNLLKVFGKKGGMQGRKIKSILIPITQTDAIDVRRECIIKALCLYLNEEPENLVKEYKNTDGEACEAAMMETMFGIYVIRKEGAEPDDDPEDVGVVLEGVQVLDELGNVPLAVVMLFVLLYALNLS
ncbi:uncharacterized protein LOC121636988 [Melanotaenia boesemani]|uniref:uncharacterized protein LOC121636988 n=1 Tax=Melanotaenia boesemani TaxID=1250792 RepID=UPI001C03CA86|nr:uncharacterized protein LOC121636988 [Melanotaenia boesemani]